MTANDLALFAPVIAAVLLAAAILVVDFIAPGRFVPAILVTFMGLTVVGALTAITGQTATPSATGSLTAFGGAYVVADLTTYLDLLFIKGLVARKFVADGRHLVEIEQEAHNQDHEQSVVGSGIVELPSRT